MKNARGIPSIPDLPEEIFEDIFSRLPVNTLLRFKCLGKHWGTLFSTPRFISEHLNKFSSDPDANYILFDTWGRTDLTPVRNLSRMINLNQPRDFYYNAVGSVNGLVCLTSNDFYTPICLWNPLINQCMFLPLPNVKRPTLVSVGFGYEQNSDDYKVMRVINYYNGRQETKLEVYSTKSGSWRKVKNDVYVKVKNAVFSTNCDAIVEGFTYWFITNENGLKTALASFDLRSEVFSIIPVPEVLATESYSLRAMNSHGSLALLAHSSEDEFKKCLEVWVIEGGGGAEGVWQKKSTVNLGFDFSRHWGLTSGFTVVEKAPNMLFLVDLRTEQSRKIGEIDIRRVFYYTESLVSIEGFEPVPSQ
ncbi:hypothetical protein CQW23_04248 [Capsicum baccatum]|uniref:F-box domain-containing protein n=1 Tax=Capsicum baccatum TaxID=33114 RepID=A0A2G2XE33_CAPBA|nr:hypothetical protein CQW23_04248 [Capsicum baccatum]